MPVQHIQQIGWENGKPITLTGQQYRVLYYASKYDVIHVQMDSSGKLCDGWRLRGGELITATVKSLIVRGYLRRESHSVHLTGEGRDAMVKYWSKRKEQGAVDGDLGQEA